MTARGPRPKDHVFLVVLKGERKGSRFPIGEGELLLGRATSAAICLRDQRVSRMHAYVSQAAGDLLGVRFRCCADAIPILIEGKETRDGVANIGQHVIVGETVLEVVSAKAGEQTTDVHALLSGVASDVRGLSSIVALTETLDTAARRADVPERLTAWAERHVGATRVRLLEEDQAPSRQVVARTDGSGERSVVTVPTHAELGARIEFEFGGQAGGPLPLTLLRLLAVAGRVCGSTLARLDTQDALEREQEAFRRLAIGGARAFLGGSEAATRVTKLVARLAASDSVVLLEGETGVGKTFVARLIHEGSARASGALRVVNCAAIPENLLESELFGHERGAFTGAVASRAGVFEAAGKGTVFLDEIGELPLASQSKLLHVLEDKRFARVGSTNSIPLLARVLAATNRDLEEMVRQRAFRQDLFFRLTVVRLTIPPLRERGEDLLLLANQILDDLRASFARRLEGFSEEAVEVLRRYPWPGNVRELRNVIEHALVLGEGRRISLEDLPAPVRAGAAAAVPPGREPVERAPDTGGPRMVKIPANLEWLESQAIDAALKATDGNRTQAAAILGINRATLYKKRPAEAKE
jgi:DNA-binding NtrC family response regulator